MDIQSDTQQVNTNLHGKAQLTAHAPPRARKRRRKTIFHISGKPSQDCGGHGLEPPALVLILQVNQVLHEEHKVFLGEV